MFYHVRTIDVITSGERREKALEVPVQDGVREAEFSEGN